MAAKTLQEKVEAAIRETLRDPEGAGSDLSYVSDRGPGNEWMFVEGNLDVAHLASVTIQAVKDYL